MIVPELVVDEATLERGLAYSSLVIDTRLRDALRALAGENIPVSQTGSRKFRASA